LDNQGNRIMIQRGVSPKRGEGTSEWGRRNSKEKDRAEAGQVSVKGKIHSVKQPSRGGNNV